MHLFPVRHHSPRASAVLRGFLDAVQPEVVLVEGPSDATSLVEVLVDNDTEPPVAILGFRTDGTPGSSLWPFASYSPEYVAIQWAVAHGRRAAFIDIPTGTSLASHDREHVDIDDAGAEEDAAGAVPEASMSDLCAERTGFRSFEEFWEASFEAPAHDLDSFRSALARLRRSGAQRRSQHLSSRPRCVHVARDRGADGIGRALRQDCRGAGRRARRRHRRR